MYISRRSIDPRYTQSNEFSNSKLLHSILLRILQLHSACILLYISSALSQTAWCFFMVDNGFLEGAEEGGGEGAEEGGGGGAEEGGGLLHLLLQLLLHLLLQLLLHLLLQLGYAEEGSGRGKKRRWRRSQRKR